MRMYALAAIVVLSSVVLSNFSALANCAGGLPEGARCKTHCRGNACDEYWCYNNNWNYQGGCSGPNCPPNSCPFKGRRRQ
jgi:hypothetical protein